MPFDGRQGIGFGPHGPDHQDRSRSQHQDNHDEQKSRIVDAIAALERARETVRRRWSRGCWIQPNGYRCAASALVIAIHGDDYPFEDSPLHLEYEYSQMRNVHPAFVALQDFARSQRHTYGGATCGSIIAWNDDRSCAADIVAGFDHAIDNLRQQLAEKGMTTPALALSS